MRRVYLGIDQGTTGVTAPFSGCRHPISKSPSSVGRATSQKASGLCGGGSNTTVRAA